MRRPGLVAGPLLFSYYFYSNELRETKMPNSADLFLAWKGFGLFGFRVLMFGFGCFEDLTYDFWAENAEMAIISRFALRGLRSAFGRAVGRFAAGIDAGLKSLCEYQRI
jgi:hypothetical protein